MEEKLGIKRLSKGIDGIEAMRLWERFRCYRDEEALRSLLGYNRDDVVNLYHLEACLERIRRKKG